VSGAKKKQAGQAGNLKKRSCEGLKFRECKNHPLVEPKTCSVGQSIFQ
jgi:hypothetical protein